MNRTGWEGVRGEGLGMGGVGGKSERASERERAGVPVRSWAAAAGLRARLGLKELGG